jgi:exopolysaccharide biosynthesis WecB/TagA/CpsF family protein
MSALNANLRWPPKRRILNILVSEINYDDALKVVFKAASSNLSSCVTHLAVHGLIEGSFNKRFSHILNNLDIVAPDGHPVRMAMNKLYNTNLDDRCYGPEFMMRVCRESEINGTGIYLYGSYPHVVENLSNNLMRNFPKLKILGSEPSIFRPLTDNEDKHLIERINRSGAKIVFIGLGCPLQETFAYEHKDKINAVMICVGAAFDFLSGEKKMAPGWMQNNSLEWLFRLSQEPRRLFKRYFVTNTVFCVKILIQFIQLRFISS